MSGRRLLSVVTAAVVLVTSTTLTEAQEDLDALRRAGEQGTAEAQYQLGGMYYFGDGVREDTLEAVRWYHRAAEQGDPAAQYQLAEMYDVGMHSPAAAVRWYRLAAEQGDAAAQNQLGRMYDFGRGVPEDDVEAVRWYRLAAQQGHADAQVYLGVIHKFGLGVRQDAAEAMRWYLLAAKQGHVEAQGMLGDMLNICAMYAYGYSHGWTVVKDESGCGQIVLKDLAEAVRWYRRAAE